ncbi:MAG: DUF1501 domain-containing protein [Candidatus Hydrogenedentes bacterium]|nr:DUF1501 domain-containing protein [Candidatus Hydrogenedentota bacterium]
MKHPMTRRDFMKHAAVFSAIGVAPQFLTRTAAAASRAIGGFKDDRVLVVVQLGGGNDGLNTLVPYGDDAYYRARPRLGLREDRLIKLDDAVAFNDKLDGLMRLYDSGRLAVVQGVGYPNPDRSHFRSMEIWHTATDSDEYSGTGWIGRYFDHHCSGSARPQVGVAVAKERPQAFNSKEGFGVAFENVGSFGWRPGQGAATEEAFSALNAGGHGDTNLDFLRHVTSNAIMSAREVKEAAESVRRQQRRAQQMGPALETVSRLIKGDLATRIYFVSVSGFDTHSNQAGQHDALLERVGNRLSQFQEALRSDGTADRVMTMVFSEFGRRVNENASGGTDHGTAAPMFLIGDGVRPGLHGTQPSLDNLDQGDLKHTVDFRQVYATVLEDWFQVDPKPVLGRRFDTLDLIV